MSFVGVEKFSADADRLILELGEIETRPIGRSRRGDGCGGQAGEDLRDQGFLPRQALNLPDAKANEDGANDDGGESGEEEFAHLSA